ncbi:C-type lectin domain family 4 member E-like [Acanthaster planci]|uniref:C-type lectin domain family 4 member E-like n=1 Tax=Acanthaster planci TaxID=133434 RepID=A0A8B7ZWT9_ACAPL|nr:C-type lectin domain family 4 member E-like [Acanthaster planci]
MMLPKGFIFGLMNLCLMIRCTGGNERCVASIRGACPPDWSQWGDKCYRKLPVNLPWAEAKEECIKMGSVLVMPQSQEETEFLLENLHRYFWINCNDIQAEDSWECQDGTFDVTFRSWRAGEPSNDGKGEDCAVVIDKGGWNDVSCGNLVPAICQRCVPRLLLLI